MFDSCKHRFVPLLQYMTGLARAVDASAPPRT
jgi:hypothetical protein